MLTHDRKPMLTHGGKSALQRIGAMKPLWNGFTETQNHGAPKYPLDLHGYKQLFHCIELCWRASPKSHGLKKKFALRIFTSYRDTPLLESSMSRQLFTHKTRR